MVDASARVSSDDDTIPPRLLTGSASGGDWRYLAEGGAHLVLEYVGQDPTLSCKVLRLGKVKLLQGDASGADAGDVRAAKPPTMHLGITDTQLWAGVCDASLSRATSEEERTHALVAAVLLPLLGDHLADAGELVRVDNSFLAAVAAAAAPLRPIERAVNTGLDDGARFAVLLRNRNVIAPFGLAHPCPKVAGAVGTPLEQPPVFSVEIKPKFGFIPESRSRGVSRFQMHQMLKLWKGEIDRVSQYDPPDLFFGVGATDARADSSSSKAERRSRARQALLALVNDPQNNLCVRRTDYPGAPVYGRGASRIPVYSPSAQEFGESHEVEENEGHETDGIMKLARALKDGFFPAPLDGMSPEGTVNIFIDVVASCLEHSGVMARVLEMQRLDRIGVERAAELAECLSARAATFARGMDAGVEDQGCNAGVDDSAFDVEESGAIQSLRDFVVAATAKDCSVILAIQQMGCPPTPFGAHCRESDGTMLIDVTHPEDRSDVGEEIISAGERLVYRCRASVVDLDIKSVRKLPAWLALDKEIVAHYDTVNLT